MTIFTLGYVLHAVTYALKLAEIRYTNRPLSAAIRDTSEELLSLARMDNAKLLTIELTQRKTYTSSRPSRTTQAFLQYLQKKRLDINYSTDPCFATLLGGISILYQGKCLGVVTVGDLSAQEDHDAALSIAEILLKEIAQREGSPCCISMQPPL